MTLNDRNVADIYGQTSFTCSRMTNDEDLERERGRLVSKWEVMVNTSYEEYRLCSWSPSQGSALFALMVQRKKAQMAIMNKTYKSVTALMGAKSGKRACNPGGGAAAGETSSKIRYGPGKGVGR